MTPGYWNEATAHLSESCPTMREIIENYPDELLKGRGDAFYTLARSITGQQISVKAADAVWNRLVTAVSATAPPAKRKVMRSAGLVCSTFPSSKPLQPDAVFTPQLVLSMSDETLRASGLSGQKIKYLRNLAEFFLAEKITPGFWDKMSDEEVIQHITQIKGIGVWTAEMFMIFHLLRPDVLPVADIGLQKAVIKHYPRVKTPSPENLRKISRKWQPYRSVATWYLWRSLDPIPVEY